MASDVKRGGLNCDVFCGIGQRHCKDILALSRKATFVRNQMLFSQGARIDRVLVIETGQVKITHSTPEGNEVILWILGPGDMVDARIDLDRQACSATAMEDSSTLTWENHRFLTLREQFPRIRENLANIVFTRLWELEDRFCELAHQSARQRLARSLLRLLAQVGSANCSCVVRVTHEELGRLTGLTIFTISRLLSNWSASGVLEQGRASLVIRDISSLELLTRAEPEGAMKRSTEGFGAGGRGFPEWAAQQAF